MDRITLDRDVFKVLASDTRLDILKALDERQKTVTELARELELNKATVFEHLEKLAGTDLVRKLEDERKWVYYQLSWTGRRLLHPEKITIALLLSSAVASVVTAGAAFWLYSGASDAFDGAADGGASERSAEAADSAPAAAMPAPQPEAASDALAADPTMLIAATVLVALAVLLGLAAVIVWRRARAAASAA